MIAAQPAPEGCYCRCNGITGCEPHFFNPEIRPLLFCAIPGLQAVYKSRVAICSALHSYGITPPIMAGQGSELVVFTPKRKLMDRNQR